MLFFRRTGIWIILFSLFSAGNSHSQGYDISFGIGGAMYGGDLNSQNFGNNVKQSKWAGDVRLHKRFNPNIEIFGGFLAGRIAGDDRFAIAASQKERNLHFFSPIYELSAGLNYYFFGYDYRQEGRFFTPLVSLGVAGFYFDPRTTYNGDNYRLQPLGTEGQGIQGKARPYKLYQGAIFAGAGAKVRINARFAISAELNIRFTSTDYLDDVSTTYVSYDDLLFFNGETAAILSQRIDEFHNKEEGTFPGNYAGKRRGNPEVNDYYFIGLIRLHYNLGPRLFYRVDCPPI